MAQRELLTASHKQIDTQPEFEQQLPQKTNTVHPFFFFLIAEYDVIHHELPVTSLEGGRVRNRESIDAVQALFQILIILI